MFILVVCLLLQLETITMYGDVVKHFPSLVVSITTNDKQ